MSTERQKQYAREWHRRKRERIRQSLDGLSDRLRESAQRKLLRRQRLAALRLQGQPIREWITERVA